MKKINLHIELILLPEKFLKKGLFELKSEFQNDRYLELSPRETFLEALMISNFLLKFHQVSHS